VVMMMMLMMMIKGNRNKGRPRNSLRKDEINGIGDRSRGRPGKIWRKQPWTGGLGKM
jgi:hypothetical protein